MSKKRHHVAARHYAKRRDTLLRGIEVAEDRVGVLKALLKDLDADGTKIKAHLCAEYGHPPVVNVCLGQVTCARCGEILGDVLAGVFSLTGQAVVGHGCSVCDTIWAGMSEEQRLLTPHPGPHPAAQSLPDDTTEAK